MKKLLKGNVLPILILLIGLVFLLYPRVSDLYYNYKFKLEMDAYMESIANTLSESNSDNYSELWKAAREYNESLVGKTKRFYVSESDKEYVNTLLNPLGTGLVGFIEIPKIGVYLPIFHGIEEKVLQSGCGLMYGGSLPTGNLGEHSVITAHSGLAKAKMFTDISKLNNGDKFTVYILDKTFTYKVNQSIVVEPEDLSGLEIYPDKNYMTLYTCTPYGINTHRLLVRGALVSIDTDELDDNLEDIEGSHSAEVYQADNYYLYGIGISIIALILIGLAVLKSKNKDDDSDNSDEPDDSDETQ